MTKPGAAAPPQGASPLGGSARSDARGRHAGAFVAEGDGWKFSGVLAFDDAMSVVEAARSLPLPRSGIVDLAGLVHADSSALAVMLALRRRAAAEGHHELRFTSVPPVVDSLARVYGVEHLIAEQP
jgi:ABC-type transporter Mla MlaB component